MVFVLVVHMRCRCRTQLDGKADANMKVPVRRSSAKCGRIVVQTPQFEIPREYETPYPVRNDDLSCARAECLQIRNQPKPLAD
jgi:hypothetical protein